MYSSQELFSRQATQELTFSTQVTQEEGALQGGDDATCVLTSGAGLIFSGVLILGVAWTALRVARRFAPPKEGASA